VLIVKDYFYHINDGHIDVLYKRLKRNILLVKICIIKYEMGEVQFWKLLSSNSSAFSKILNTMTHLAIIHLSNYCSTFAGLGEMIDKRICAHMQAHTY
jgi:hypothetical protein